jgi:hypothetical protein
MSKKEARIIQRELFCIFDITMSAARAKSKELPMQDFGRPVGLIGFNSFTKYTIGTPSS